MTTRRNGPSVWYIHPYAGGPGFGTHHRPYQLCHAWNESYGCRARVIFPSFHHCLSTASEIRKSFVIGSVHYHPVPSTTYSGNSLKRVVHMLEFSARLRPFCRDLCKQQPQTKPDFIIVSSPHPFCASGAVKLARDLQAKLVFEIRDIWPLSLVELSEAPAWHPFVLFAGACERSALRSADLVASVLPRADRYLADRGFGAKPFVWAPNGLKEENVEGAHVAQSPVTREVLEKLHALKGQGRVIMIYVGSIGPPNGVKRLVEALRSDHLLPLRRKLAVMLVGSGSERIALEADGLGAHLAIHWSRGPIPSADVPAVLEKADFAYAGLRNLPNLYRYGVSLNKLPEYMGAGLPVILPCEPCGDLVSESCAGIVHAAANSDDLARMIAAMASMSEQERNTMGQRGRRYVVENYSYRGIAARYLDALRTIGENN